MYRFILKNTFKKIYIYHFLINIFIKIVEPCPARRGPPTLNRREPVARRPVRQWEEAHRARHAGRQGPHRRRAEPRATGRPGLSRQGNIEPGGPAAPDRGEVALTTARGCGGRGGRSVASGRACHRARAGTLAGRAGHELAQRGNRRRKNLPTPVGRQQE